MNNFEQTKQTQFNVMFFTIKILALFFCATPLFQYFFKEDTTETLENINFAVIITFLVILSIIMFMWLIMDRNRMKMRFSTVIEVVLFYSVCLTSVLISGSYTSYYKFIFIFLVVSYTIEAGMKVGMTIAVISAVIILLMDLILFKAEGVNLYFQADIALSAMFVVVAWILGFYVKVEQQHIEELKNFANVDGLTGLYNHRYFHEILKQECDKCIKTGQPLSLIMIDIDYFKIYNDVYGHQQGDEILKQIAKALVENVREGDMIFRYGGDEFTGIFPNTGAEETKTIAESLRRKIADYEFFGRELLPNHVLTISIGVADFFGKNDLPMEIINRADSALYRSKFFRKNRVELYASIFDQFTHLDEASGDGMISVKSLITIINSRDQYTYNHTERVVQYCQVFADSINLPEKQRRDLIYGAYLHDIGKINVSKSALISDKKLTAEEWAEMKKHPVDSAEIIRQMDGLEDIVDIVLQHHEKYDGTGYPSGLKGEEIHPLARMLTLADSFDAMTSKRPYQNIRTFEEAFAEIRRCAGTHFDPKLCEPFIRAISSAL